MDIILGSPTLNKSTQTDLLLSYPDIVNQLLQDLTKQLIDISATSDTTTKPDKNDDVLPNHKTNVILYSEVKKSPKDRLVTRGKVRSLQNHFEQLGGPTATQVGGSTPGKQRLTSYRSEAALMSPGIVLFLEKKLLIFVYILKTKNLHFIYDLK